MGARQRREWAEICEVVSGVRILSLDKCETVNDDAALLVFLAPRTRFLSFYLPIINYLDLRFFLNKYFNHG